MKILADEIVKELAQNLNAYCYMFERKDEAECELIAKDILDILFSIFIDEMQKYPLICIE